MKIGDRVLHVAQREPGTIVGWVSTGYAEVDWDEHIVIPHLATGEPIESRCSCVHVDLLALLVGEIAAEVTLW